MKLASRTTRITPSPTLQLSATVKALMAQGQRVFDFTAGEPSFDSPDEAKQAAITAIQSGFTKYTAVTGIDELKDAIIDKFQCDQGISYSRPQVVVSCGAKHTLFNLALALFEAGDEKELAALLQNLSEEQLRNMALACQQAAMDHSMEHHLERLMEVYQGLGGSRR